MLGRIAPSSVSWQVRSAAPEIKTEPLLEYEVVIVGKSALVPRRPSRDNLEKLAWISREEGSATRISSDEGLARVGIVPGRRLELPSNEAPCMH